MLDASIEGFREYGYRVSWNLTPAELRKVGELRADVFCRELGWTGSREDSVERDEFDDDSTHIAIFDDSSELIGAVRITKAAAPWMLDTVFAELAPATRIKKTVDTAESSRLAVSRKWRGKRVANGMRACDVIYRAAYLYCRVNGIRQLYLVTSDIVLAHMRRAGLPCTALTAPHEMPDGVRALTVVIDWDRLRDTATFDRWFPATPRPRSQPRPAAAVALSSAA